MGYADVILADSPAGYWPCDGLSGMGGNNLALQGTGASFVTGLLRTQTTQFGVGSATNGAVMARVADCWIQHAAVYASALSAATIARHYAEGFRGGVTLG